MITAALAATLVTATLPHPSFHQVVTSNGYTAAIYDEQRARVTHFGEHLYKDVDATTPVRNLAYDAYFGLRLNGSGLWLGEQPTAPAVRYLPGTGVVEAVQRIGTGVEATTFLFAPFGAEAPAATMLLRVRNLGTAPLGANDAAFSLHNFHVGEGASQAEGERIDWDPTRGLFVEKVAAGGRAMVFLPLVTPLRHGASPSNPYPLVRAGSDLTDVASSGATNDAVSGFQWSLGGLAAGAEAWFGVAFAYHPFGNDAEIGTALATWSGGRGPKALLDAELAQWDAWHALDAVPPEASADELAVYRQQLAILRMAQVREPNHEPSGYRPHGQILASLPPGGWNITWVRDGLVAVRALIRAGHHAEARDALEFFLKAQAGTYSCCDRTGAPYVGMPYQISVVRYFGRGLEESDSNADGPNIEFDGFGMFLDGLDAYERASGDRTLGDQHWAAVSGKVADVLVALAQDDGLLRADSSIWETHWENGGRQHWAWTNLYAVVGLRAAANMAERRGDGATAVRYAVAADAIRAAMARKMIGADDVLRGRSDATAVPEDAAAIEAFVRGVFPADGAAAQATLDRLKQRLWVAAGHGYRRNLGPSEYDAREWILCDLRIADALRHAGRGTEADALVTWITEQARQNFDLIPENFDPATSDYLGAIPMVGFGAGAYALTLFARSDPPEVIPPGPDAGLPPSTPDAGRRPDAAQPRDAGTAPAADAGATTSPDGGCSCGAAGGAASVAALLPLLFLRSRRRPV